MSYIIVVRTIYIYIYIYIRILSEDILTDGRYYITRVTRVFMESEKQSIVNNELNLICLNGICQGSVIKTAKANKRCIVYLRQSVILYGKCHDKNKSSPMVIYFVSSSIFI